GVEEAASPLPDTAVGELPPTPIMRWLLESGGPIDRFNQSMLLRVPAGVGYDHLIAALQAVFDHHDGLRLRLVSRAEDDGWSLEVAPPGAVKAASCLCRIDVSGLDDEGRSLCIAEQGRAAESRLAPGAGVMVQAVWFEAGEGRAGRLLLIIHHLAVDGVSWRILVPDLAAAWEAVAAGGTARPSPRGAPLRSLVRRASAPRAQRPRRMRRMRDEAGSFRSGLRC